VAWALCGLGRLFDVGDVDLPQGYMASLWACFGPLRSREISTIVSVCGKVAEGPTCGNAPESRLIIVNVLWGGRRQGGKGL
jgi:hypothetical protein